MAEKDPFCLADLTTEEKCEELARPLSEATRQWYFGNTTGLPKLFGELRYLLRSPVARPHPLAKKALVASTRSEHIRVLAMMRTAPKSYDTWNTPTALLEVLAQERRTRAWKWATAAKKAASLQGALEMLPMYLTTGALALGTDPEWTQGMRHLAAKAREEAQENCLNAGHIGRLM